MSGANSLVGNQCNHATGQPTPPILFLIFNRPEITAKSFEAIANAKPTRLYVAADGPRPGKKNEAALCEAARRVATAVNWPCEVRTLFRDKNLGCQHAVSDSISWFFEHELEGIILEDDCVAGPDFFPYAQELLKLYRNNERVMCISAQHFHGDAHRPLHSYFFSRYNHCWGWASWRRAWQHYDADMSDWPQLRETDLLKRIGDGSRWFTYYWTTIFDRCFNGEIDSWAYRWTLSCWLHGGLTILPAHSLVNNIGFGADSTHTRKSSENYLFQIERISFPLRHPPQVIRDENADRWTDRFYFKVHRTAPVMLLMKHLPNLAKLIKTIRQ